MLGVVFILSVEVLLSRIPGHLDESSLWRLARRMTSPSEGHYPSGQLGITHGHRTECAAAGRDSPGRRYRTPEPITRKQAPVKQASRKSAQHRRNLYAGTIEPPGISAAICMLPASAAACKRERRAIPCARTLSVLLGTQHRRLSHDCNRRRSGQFKTAICGRKCSCRENGWLSVLSITCFLSGCFDDSHQFRDPDADRCGPAQAPLTGLGSE